MLLEAVDFVSIVNPEFRIPFRNFHETKCMRLQEWPSTTIFNSLKKGGFDIMTHISDHHVYQPSDLNFSDALGCHDEKMR